MLHIHGAAQELAQLKKENEALFSDAEAAKSSLHGFDERHRLLRGQISSFVLPISSLN